VLGKGKPADTLLVRHQAVTGVAGDRRFALNRDMHRHVVAHDQDMLVLVVLEKVVDAFLFHQPTDKVEIAFPVLDTESPFAIGVFQGEAIAGGDDAGLLQ